MKLPPSEGSTTPRSSRWFASTPVSSTATAIESSPVVRFHAAGTFMRPSSHWRMPSGLVTPRKEERSCHGSAAKPSGTRSSAPRWVVSIESWKYAVTARFALRRAAKPVERGTTPSAPISLRSETTTPPAEATAARICAGVVWAENRTTVSPNGFPAAEEDPVSASAATSAASRRVGRFTISRRRHGAAAPPSLVLGKSAAGSRIRRRAAWPSCGSRAPRRAWPRRLPPRGRPRAASGPSSPPP